MYMSRIRIGNILIDQILGLVFLVSILFAFYKNYYLHAYYGINYSFSYYKLTHFIFFNAFFISIFTHFIHKNLAMAGMIMYFFIISPICILCYRRSITAILFNCNISYSYNNYFFPI